MELTKFSTLSSLFALLMVVSAKILIPMNGELISIQLFFVVLAGLVGGNMIGLTAQLIYVMFGFFVPVFYNNELAMVYFTQPNHLFQLLYPLIALAVGSYISIYKGLWLSIGHSFLIIITAILVFILIYFTLTNKITLSNYLQKNTAMFISYFIETTIAVVLFFYWQKINRKSISH
jgi:biotin transporter BioY